MVMADGHLLVPPTEMAGLCGESLPAAHNTHGHPSVHPCPHFGEHELCSQHCAGAGRPQSDGETNGVPKLMDQIVWGVHSESTNKRTERDTQLRSAAVGGLGHTSGLVGGGLSET